MASRSELDVVELRRIAEAATPGPWGADCCRAANMVYANGGHIGVDATEVDAQHIAAFDPPTVLALLDRLERAEAAATPATEWEYGFTSKWGVRSCGSDVVRADQDAYALRRSIETGRESGDLEFHGKVVRRVKRGEGPWVELEQREGA